MESFYWVQIPFILRIHLMDQRVTKHQAKANVALWFREKKHLRSPHFIDYLVNKSYELLYQAEQHHTADGLINTFLSPDVLYCFKK